MCLCLFSSVSSHRKKMMCRILLLLMLTCCVCGTFEVNVSQSFYQAEENQSITLEWTFTPQDDPSLHSLRMLCLMVTDHKVSTLFELMGGVEVPAPEHKQFAGRVHCDKDVLKEGRLRLHVSSLRTEDSGRYVCDMKMKNDAGRGECSLNVTAAAHEPETQRPTGRPGPESRGRPGLYAGLGLVLLAASAGLALCVCDMWF
ncbi:programmed cell death 1 ligand 1-like isoform X2 [Labrus mixtus]|uniref:programmed cell death 1 ligand 1-like isoform X2 n=1 Tax=Labrus mixtus TaxID=508554 RepID=UPI0029BFB361|nr:programmed cell death 1 ligand 1-like isoform X2 [Labrus mixtus]